MIQDELNDGYSSRVKQQESDRVRRIIDDLTLFDDDMMSLVFDKNIPATQLLLRIILKRDIIVKSVKGQEEFKKGLPIYSADRTIMETGEALNDGAHIIYVNGTYTGNDEFGKLMQDFHSRDSKEMHYKELADSVHHFKETKKGREIMCEAVKKYAEEYNIENKAITVQNLMKNTGWTLEQTLDNMGVSDKVERDTIICLLKKDNQTF